MSSKGSAFAGDGREYLQEPPAKQARYEHHPAPPHVIEGEGKITEGLGRKEWQRSTCSIVCRN